MKEKFLAWVKNHPDVWHKGRGTTAPWWWVANCLGSLGILTWADLYEIQNDHENEN